MKDYQNFERKRPYLKSIVFFGTVTLLNVVLTVYKADQHYYNQKFLAPAENRIANINGTLSYMRNDGLAGTEAYRQLSAISRGDMEKLENLKAERPTSLFGMPKTNEDDMWLFLTGASALMTAGFLCYSMRNAQKTKQEIKTACGSVDEF